MHRTLLLIASLAVACSEEGGSGSAVDSGPHECTVTTGACVTGDTCFTDDHCGVGGQYSCPKGTWTALSVECPGRAPLANPGCSAVQVTLGAACSPGDGPCDYGCETGGNRMLRADCVSGVWTAVPIACD
jgi:hypothetical protein